MFAYGTVGLIIFSPVFFLLLQTGDPAWITVAMIIAIGLVFSLLYGPEGALFAAQFKPEVRYTGISVEVQVSGAIGGGLAPLVATSLLAFGDGNPLYISCYLMALGVIALFAVRAMKSVSEPIKTPTQAPHSKHFTEQKVQSSEA